MAFRNYLEGEDDKPYFHLNSLAYYYEKMEGFAAAVENAAKTLNLTKEEIDQRVTAYILENKTQLDLRFGEWDEKLLQFDGSVMDLLAEWVDDGTLNHIIDTTLINQKVAPLTALLADISVNVKSFGAVGDGVTDDTKAVGDAIRELKKIKGGTLLFPSGFTYRVNANSVDFPKEKIHNVTVLAHGAIVKATDDSLGKAFYLTGSNLVLNGGTFDGNFLKEDGTINIQNDGQPGTQTALAFGGNNMIVKDVFIKNAVNDGFAIGLLTKAHIENITVENTGEHSIYFSYSSNVTIKNIKSVNPSLSHVSDLNYHQPTVGGSVIKLRHCNNVNIDGVIGVINKNQTSSYFMQGSCSNLKLNSINVTGVTAGIYLTTIPESPCSIPQKNIELESVVIKGAYHLNDTLINLMNNLFSFTQTDTTTIKLKDCAFTGGFVGFVPATKYENITLTDYGKSNTPIPIGNTLESVLINGLVFSGINSGGYVLFNTGGITASHFKNITFLGDVPINYNRLNNIKTLIIENLIAIRETPTTGSIFSVTKDSPIVLKNCYIENYYGYLKNNTSDNGNITMEQCTAKNTSNLLADSGQKFVGSIMNCTTNKGSLVFALSNPQSVMNYGGGMRIATPTVLFGTGTVSYVKTDTV